MAGVNKVILIGNLGRDPEIRTFEGGGKLANFSLATNEKYKNKAGEPVENTEWHNIVVFGKLADVVESYLKAGNQIYLEGKLKTEKYEKDGTTRYTTKIICSSLTMLGGGSGSGGGEKPQISPCTQPKYDNLGNPDDLPF